MIVDISVIEMKERLLSYSNCWTSVGARVMAQWLNDFAKDDAKFDAVEISCKFKEYAHIIEWAEEYFDDYKKFFAIREHDSSEFVDELLYDWIGKRTIIITFAWSVIIKEINVEYTHLK